jgi:hypothetical protein
VVRIVRCNRSRSSKMVQTTTNKHRANHSFKFLAARGELARPLSSTNRVQAPCLHLCVRLNTACLRLPIPIASFLQSMSRNPETLPSWEVHQVVSDALATACSFPGTAQGPLRGVFPRDAHVAGLMCSGV